MVTISSRKNPLIAHLKKLGADRNYRRQTGTFLCEGTKLLNEALKAGLNIETVLTSDSEPILPVAGKTVRVTPDVMQALTSMKSVPDVLFSCEIPCSDLTFGTGKHMILEDLQDPGNIGTIIRTANAFGIDTVILAGSCADPYGPKAVRASMGAVYRQNIVETGTMQLVSLFQKRNVPIYAASVHRDAVDIRQAKLPASLGIAIGNEGRGLSKELLEACSGSLTIPMNPMCESLNAAAAAAVLMWELFR